MSLEFNNPFYIGNPDAAAKSAISQLKTDVQELQGDVSNLQSDVGNLDSLDTVDKSSLVNAINEALSVLDPTQTADYINNSKGLKSGDVSTNSIILNDIKDYAHSTFDRSKFTVVGSPNITDDGIASGFSGSNYISNNIAIDCSKNFEIEFNTTRFNNNESIRHQTFWSVYNSSWTDDCFYIASGASYYGAGGSLVLIYPTGNDTSDTKLYNNVFSLNENVNIKMVKTSSSIALYANNVLLDTITIDNTYFTFISSNLNIGTSVGDGHAKFLVDKQIDLKQFSITVDGVEVFSGNKTGVDTIKPDDYTVVGSGQITISDDGILSGYPSSITGQSYITNSVYIPNSALMEIGSKKWKLIWRGKTQDINGILRDNAQIFGRWQGDAITTPIVLGFWNSSLPKHLYFNATVNNNGTPEYLGQTFLGELSDTQMNAYYNGSIEYDGTSFIITFNFDDGTSLSKSIATSSPVYIEESNSILVINWCAQQPIDLNSIKIYVDGDLVCQPCLKIPYTESKTGSKIVNAIYRDRVNDMAEQFGYANYYTLDEDNGNFTLPHVELYGLIGQRTLRDSYRNGINYWELYSNRDLEQGGSCTSGVEVTFANPFADTNYVLSVPYSAKSSTAFTPTQTGDWIAKGKGLL